MASEIPYVTVPGSIQKILQKIKEAATPDIFSQDFLKTKLGFNGGNYLTFIPWAKKCGLLNSDGTPSALYRQFRNPPVSGQSIAKAIKTGYSELYSRNEYCHDLNKGDFKGLVMEATGEPHDSAKIEKIVSTFFNVKSLANFDLKHDIEETDEKNEKEYKTGNTDTDGINKNSLKLGLNYTINLVLPKTDDPSIYNAIFKSLKENLLNG